MVLGMVTSVGGYYGYTSLMQAGGPDEPVVEAADIALDIERYNKVSTLASAVRARISSQLRRSAGSGKS